VERDHLLVEPDPARLALADDLGREGPLAVARRADPHRTLVGQDRFRRLAVAGVARPARRCLPARVAQVLGDLGVQRALEQPPRELTQQPFRARDLLRGPGAREQFVDQLIRQLRAIEQSTARQPQQRRRPRRRRGAGAELRSPSGIAALNAGASLDLLDPAGAFTGPCHLS